VVAGLLGVGVIAQAQQATKVARIGYMSIPSRESAEDLIQIFLQELREHGWVERQNLSLSDDGPRGSSTAYPASPPS
jgi:hypothetical protein